MQGMGVESMGDRKGSPRKRYSWEDLKEGRGEALQAFREGASREGTGSAKGLRQELLWAFEGTARSVCVAGMEGVRDETSVRDSVTPQQRFLQ